MFAPGRRKPARLPSAAAALLVACVLAGCSAGAGQSGKHLENPAAQSLRIPTAVEAARMEVPLARYTVGLADGRAINAAESRLVAQCAARYGLTLAPERRDGGAEPGTSVERRYGITDRKLAAVSGYGMGDKPAKRSAEPHTKIPEYLRTAILSGRGPATVNGRKVPDQGCSGEARETLAKRAAPSRDQNLALSLMDESFYVSQRDPRVRKVISGWSACMQRSGYDYNDPLDAAGDTRFGTGKTRLERDVALADIDCKEAVNLTGIWFAVESEYQQGQLAENRAQLEDASRAGRARVVAARGILDRAGS